MVAIRLKEPGYERALDAIDTAEIVAAGLPTMVETVMILSIRLGRDAGPMRRARLSTAFPSFSIRRGAVSLDRGDAF